jgi:hypothetical protein
VRNCESGGVRACVLAITTAIALLPSFASATVVFNVEHLDVAPTGADQTVYLDVYLVDLDGINERLNDYLVAVRGPANAPGGVRFAEPAGFPSARHPFVFEPLWPGFRPPSQWIDNLMDVGVFPQGTVGTVDVSDSLNGLFSVPVFIPGNTLPGDYPVIIDPAFTFLSVSGPPVDLIVGPSGGVTVVPEPAAAAACLLALPLLRRRRSRWHPDRIGVTSQRWGTRSGSGFDSRSPRSRIEA